MSDINADVTENTITVSVSGETISATVSGGQGPQGPQGASGVSAWADITGKPSTFAPSAHAATHQLGGGDDLEVSSNQISMDPTGFSIIEDSGLQDALYSLDQAIVGRALASHNHAAGDIASGTVATARLGSGTASSSTYLRGDQTWATISTYTLPAATSLTLGGVIVGTGLSVEDGTVSANVKSVAGKTGYVTLTQNDIPSILGGVDLEDDISYLHSQTEILSGLSDALDHSSPSATLVSYFSGVLTTDSRLSDARTPTSHTHGNITNAGAIGSTANRIAVTTTSGVLTTAAIGSGLTLSGGTLTSSGGSGSSVGSDLYLWSTYR